MAVVLSETGLQTVGDRKQQARDYVKKFQKQAGGGGTSSGSAKSRAAKEKAAAEKAKKEAEDNARIEAEVRANQQRALAQQKLRYKSSQEALRDKSSERLVRALTVQEQLKQEAKRRGKAFSRSEARKFRKERGTSIKDLREATKAGREQLKKTGINIFEQVEEKVTSQKKQLLENNIKKEPQIKDIKTGTFTLAPKRTTLQIIKDIPSKITEKITGKKPREIFAKSFGIAPDVTKKTNILEVGADVAILPIKTAKAAGIITGTGAEAIAKKVAPEGIDVKLKRKEFTVFTPEFGTVTAQQPTGVKKEIKVREAQTVKILEPKRIGEGVKAGTALGLTLVAPAAVVTPGLVLGGTRTALDKEKTTTERVIGGAEAGLGLAIGGIALTKVARTPVTITKARPVLKEPVPIQVSAVKTIGGKPTTISTFARVTEVRPETVIIRTTKGRQFLGLEPISVVKKEPKVIKQFTPLVVKDTKPFVLAEEQLGKETVKLSKVMQKTSPTSKIKPRKIIDLEGRVVPEEKLKEIETFLSTKLSTKGTQVKGVEIVKELGKPTTTLGLVKDVKKVRVTPRTLIDKPILDSKVMKTVSVSEQKLLGELGVADVYGIKTVSKTIKSPQPRPLGKIEEEKSVLFKLKPKDSQEVKVSSITGIKSQKVKDKAIAELVPAPKVKKIPEISIDVKPVKQVSIVEKGTVTPVLTNLEKPALVKDKKSMSIVSDINQKTKPVSLSKTKEDKLQVIKFKPSQITVSKGISKQKEVVEKISLNTLRQKSDQLPRLKELTKQKAISITSLIKEPKLKTPQIYVPQTTPRPPTKPTSPIVISPVIKTSAKAQIKKIAETIKGDYTVFVRKRGKDIETIKKKTKEEAVKFLAKKLKKTVAASGFIESKGRRLMVEELGLINGEFRRSKVDPFRVVQRKTKRLGTRSETSQIQLLRSSSNILSSSKRGGRNKNAFKFF